MTRIYRVLRKVFAHIPFDGEGAYLYGGRWSSVGTRLAYASEHQSLAMLEYFVHLDADEAPPDLVLITAEIPDNLPCERVPAGKLPPLWRASPAPAELTRYGDEFVRRAERCVLVVPSVLSPNENNWLVNPQHPDFKKIIQVGTEPLSYDPRMFGTKKRQRHPRPR